MSIRDIKKETYTPDWPRGIAPASGPPDPASAAHVPVMTRDTLEAFSAAIEGAPLPWSRTPKNSRRYAPSGGIFAYVKRLKATSTLPERWAWAVDRGGALSDYAPSAGLRWPWCATREEAEAAADGALGVAR